MKLGVSLSQSQKQFRESVVYVMKSGAVIEVTVKDRGSHFTVQTLFAFRGGELIRCKYSKKRAGRKSFGGVFPLDFSFRHARNLMHF